MEKNVASTKADQEMLSDLRDLQQPIQEIMKLELPGSYSKPDETGENEDSERELKKYRAKRDAGFTTLVDQFVDNYADKYKQNKRFKAIFYFWVMILFTILTLLPLIIVILAACGLLGQWEVVTAFIASLGSTITTVIVIPKIIAQYLFSLKEDETIVKIVSELHSGDLQNMSPRKPSK